MPHFYSAKWAHNSALLIRAHLAASRIPQREIANQLGFNRVTLNQYLNRHINLLPSDVVRILNALNIKDISERMSAPADHITDESKS